MKTLKAFVAALAMLCCLGVVSNVFAQTTIPVDPKATYLRTNEDPQALYAVPISLDALGIRPGDSVSLLLLGDFSYSVWGLPDDATGACGVFSANATLLPPANVNRLPGAIAVSEGAVSPCVSEVTLFGGLTTDIPADFWIDGGTIKVPRGAHYIFVAVADSYYGDNWDPDSDLAVQIQKALVAIPLNVMWRVVPWEPDRMTTMGGDELEYPSEGQIFYVAADEQEPGTTTLFRHANGPDHRDSTLTELPDYWNEGPLGFPWTSNSLPGLSPMIEGFNSETGDHALMQPGEQLAGYTTGPLGVFGYKRYYNQEESILALTKGGVTVESNRVFGGIVWRWTWNGKQFLTNLPYWAMGVKAGMTSLVPLEIDGVYRQMNEGAAGQGSPLVEAKNIDSTQVTRSAPLDSTDDTPDSPLLWRDVILGKDLTLDFKGMGPVARYTSFVSLPSAIPSAGLYHPIVSLRDEFRRFFVYHADSDFVEEVTSTVPDGCLAGDRWGTGLNMGGGIVSDASGNYALGVYSASPDDVVDFGKFLCLSEYPGDFTSIAIARTGGLSAGESTYNTYIVTGTLIDVKEKMRQLYLMGAN